MKKFITGLLHAALICFLFNTNLLAESALSKRIEVYTISQNFWDVRQGQTLGGIVSQLLADNPAQQVSLQNEIIRLNPTAFIKNNPHRLKANVRLWLPHNTPLRHHTVDRTKYNVESFSWGQVYRVKTN